VKRDEPSTNAVPRMPPRSRTNLRPNLRLDTNIQARQKLIGKAFFHLDIEVEGQFTMASVLFIFFTSLLVAISAACNPPIRFLKLIFRRHQFLEG